MPCYLPLFILQNYKHRIFYSPKILLKAHTKFVLGFENSIQQVKRQKCSCEHGVLVTHPSMARWGESSVSLRLPGTSCFILCPLGGLSHLLWDLGPA